MIRFDQTAPPQKRLVLTDTWGGCTRMSIGEFRQLAQEGTSSRFEAMAQIAESWDQLPGADHPRGPAPDQDRDPRRARPDVTGEVSGPFGIISREGDMGPPLGRSVGRGYAMLRPGK